MREQYADIIIDISTEKLDRPFQYRIPERLQVKIGMRVLVPFGKGNRIIKGYVVDISEKCNYESEKIKNISGIVSEEASVEDQMIQLAGWIKTHYGSTMIQALKTVLPAKRKIKQLEHKKIKLILSKEETISLLGECERKNQIAKARLLKELLTEGEIPYELATKKLSISVPTLNSLVTKQSIRIESISYYRNPVKQKAEADNRKRLSQEQQKIVESVLWDYDSGNPGVSLLHGITGSGKTEVYMNLIEQMIERGKQSIVLIPEIALTYQTLMRFYRRFGDRVSVMNSTLSPGEKFDQFERAKRGEIDIIIGPRSALFTPFPNIGLLVIDEEHEGSYKSETMPKYHARETAIEIARIHKASVILGSATPALESFYRAKMGEYKLFQLKERLTGNTLPTVYIVDLRQELMQGNRSIFSAKLVELMQERLQKKEQIMLFINRRGYAGFISCRACGEVIKCPHCDVSLSEHKNNRLVCHYCGYSTPKMTKCPKCNSKYISGFKAGTQQIEEKLKSLFPEAGILRMDADTTKNKDSYSSILNSFANGEADILVGTQMIVKGHDFPKVTLVGILAADLSLAGNDYMSGERTFQLLTQAAGRAGRGEISGEVVIQTYQPDHYAVVHSASQNYEDFYAEEVLYRELMGYPPIANMMAVQIYAASEERGNVLAVKLAEIAKTFISQEEVLGTRMMVIGPAPASIGKVNDIFRFVFYVKYQHYDKLVQIKDYLERYLQETELKNETVQFDFNPMHAL